MAVVTVTVTWSMIRISDKTPSASWSTLSQMAA
jgi:hypothetical protein